MTSTAMITSSTIIMDKYTDHLKTLDGLAKSRRQATEGGQYETVAILDAQMRKLEKEINHNVDQDIFTVAPGDDGSPWWLGKVDYKDLTWWWKETAGMHHLEERTEHPKEISLNSLMKTVDKNHEQMEKSIHEQPDEDMAEMSDALIEYLKREAAPHVTEQLKIYLADLRDNERIDERIMKELPLALRWKDIKTPDDEELDDEELDDEELDDIDLKTLYPTHRQLLVEDALRALRDYRQALLSYGSECDDESTFRAISSAFHRDDTRPKTATSAVPRYVAHSNDSCSCGDKCVIASLPPLRSPSSMPDLSIEDQANFERLKSFDQLLQQWSSEIYQELTSYRHYLSRGGKADSNVLKTSKGIVTLAKGKSKRDQGDTETFEGSGCTGSFQETEVAEGDTEIEDEMAKHNEGRFQGLVEDLQLYHETVAENSHLVEVDHQVLKAAQMLIEMVGENIGDQKNAEKVGKSAEDGTSVSKQEARSEVERVFSEGITHFHTTEPDLAAQVKEIEKATLEVKGEADNDLVVASEKITTLMKESANDGKDTHSYPNVLAEAQNLVKLAKEEILLASIVSIPEGHARKEKQKKTVRFASKLVEILGEMKPSSSKEK